MALKLGMLCLVVRLVGLAARPHILFLLADDLGWNDVSYHNQGKGAGATFTPTIDRLASEGAKLDSYYVNPICSPTRASIMTGRYTIRTGISHHCYGAMTGLPKNERLLSQAMKEAGYETAITGKWHLGFAQEYMVPSQRGFDHSYGHYHACIDAFNHTNGNECTPDGCKGLDWHRAQNGSAPIALPQERGKHTSHLIVTEIEQLLQQRQARNVANPLFLYVPFHMVHQGSGHGAKSWPVSGFDSGELQAPKSYVDAVPASITDRDRRVFVAMVSLLDEAVANITGLFAQYGLWNNTLLFFSSDNGSPFDTRGTNGNSPFRGQKHEMYEGGVHVPAFVRGPGVPAGSVVNHLMAHIDWFPTIVRRGEGALSQALPLDGVDQWEAITGGKAARTELLHNYDLSTVLVKNFVGGVRVGDYKLLRLGGDGHSNHTEELYDLKTDPSESINLRHNESMAGVFDQLRKKLDSYAREVVPCWCSESSPEPGVCAGKGYTGNCDKNQPTCNSPTPDAFLPGYCTNPGQDSLEQEWFV